MPGEKVINDQNFNFLFLTILILRFLFNTLQNGTEEQPETVSQEEDGQRKKKLTGYNVFFSKMNVRISVSHFF